MVRIGLRFRLEVEGRFGFGLGFHFLHVASLAM